MPPEEPEQRGSAEEEELEALPLAPTSLNGENRGIRTRDLINLALPGPLFMEGLADSALEDGKYLASASFSLLCLEALPGHA